MKTAESIINFMYFGHNFPHDFIEQVWADEKWLASHLRNKFRDMYERYNTMTFFRWVMELDHDNKKKLAEWVQENYTGGYF